MSGDREQSPRATEPLWKTYRADALIVVALFALSLFVRYKTLEPIECGGDPLDNWYFVRQWAYEVDPARSRFDHHASRFGIHWLTWVAQSLFGTHPRVYYVPPLFASTLCTLLTYTLGRLISGKVTGFVAALLLLVCEPFVAASSQLRPGIFETMYALSSAVCLVRYLETGGRAAYAWLSASAVLVFLAYLSHEPDAFLVAGMLPVVWLKRRNVRDLALFVGILGGLVVAETAAYSIFTRYWGRIAVLTESHLTRPGPPKSVGYLFERFTRASLPIKLAYFPFFVTAPIPFVFRRSLKEKAVVFVAGGFLLLITFMVRSLNPLNVFLQNHDRYVLVTVPFAYVATIHAVILGGRAFFEKYAARVLELGRRLPELAVRVAGIVLGAVLVVGIGWRAAAETRRPHPFRQIDTAYDVLNDAYRRGLPIIGKVTKRTPKITQVRALHWAHKGFLKDEFFLENGRLKNFSYMRDLAVLSKDERYVPDHPELDAERVRALEKQGCALRLSVRGSFVELSQKKRLSARCHP